MFSASFACNVVSAPKQRVLTNPKILIAQIPITGISDIGRPPLLFIKIDNDTPICLFAIVCIFIKCRLGPVALWLTSLNKG